MINAMLCEYTVALSCGMTFSMEFKETIKHRVED